MTLFQTALEYIKAGLDVIPVHPTEKYPVGYDSWQTRTFTEAEIKKSIELDGYGIGLRNQEGLDFDNHAGEARKSIKDWRNMVENIIPGLVDRLVIEKTQSGGFHLGWKCEVIEGNQKLALRKPTQEELTKEPKLKAVCFIETRGTGGQFVVAPTPGYELLRHDWVHLPIITAEERQTLINCAKALNLIPALTKDSIENSKTDPTLSRPGDLFNRDGIQEALDLLLEAGWTEVYNSGDTTYLRRPGKDKGVSASFGYKVSGLFYNFSSNGEPFNVDTSYSPFAVYAMLKHNGDFKLAAKELAQRYGLDNPITETVEALTPKGIKDFIGQRLSEKELEKKAPKTLYPELDDLIKGFVPKHLITLTGDTNVGKTSVACNFAERLCRQGKRVLYIALEPDTIILDMVSTIVTGKTYDELNESDYQKLPDNFDVFTDQIKNFEQLQKTIEASASRYDLIIIDHIGYFVDKAQNFIQEQANLLKKLALFANKSLTCILLIAHLRKPERGNVRPTMDDISGSAAFKQDSDEVLIVIREKREDDKHGVQFSPYGGIIVGKTKSTGGNGFCPLIYTKKSAYITTPEEEATKKKLTVKVESTPKEMEVTPWYV